MAPIPWPDFPSTAYNMKMLIGMHEDDVHMVRFCQRSCVIMMAMRHSLGNSNTHYLSYLWFSVGTYFLGRMDRTLSYQSSLFWGHAVCFYA